MIGRILGGFRITEQVGMGGMATIYKAYDAATDRYVAIKTLPQQYSSDPSFRARFELEARAIAKLEHIHILPMFSYGEEDGVAYMVMRYLETGTLRELMAGGRLSLERIYQLLKQIASALDYAHSHQIIHRDIKPSNVLVDNQGNAFLTDFGIAKIIESTLDLTGTGIIGTPQYMSPEQFTEGATITPASDQYSLAVMAYEMVTGHTPYEAETPLAIIQKQMMGAPFAPPRALRPDLPEAVERVLLKALSREPERRFKSCTEMVNALERAITTGQTAVHDAAPTTAFHPQDTLLSDEKTVSVKAPATEHAGVPKSKGSPVGIIVGVVALLLIGAGIIGGVMLFNRTPDAADATAPPTAIESVLISEVPPSPTVIMITAAAAVSTDTSEPPTAIPTNTTEPPTEIPTNTPEPPTAIPTETPAIVINADGTRLNDDFENTVYGGNLDPFIWNPPNPECQLSQENGVLNFSRSGCGLVMNTPGQRDDMQIFQADLRLSGDGLESTSNLGVRLVLARDIGGWGAVCGLGVEQGVPRGYFYLADQSRPDGVIYEQWRLLSFDEWHTFRLTIDRESRTFACAIDGVQLGSYTLTNAESMSGWVFSQIVDSDLNAAVDNVISTEDIQPGFGWLDAPQPLQTVSGLMEVAGWGLSSHGVDRVEILVDGELNSEAFYGVERDDVQRDYPDVPGALRSGFVGQVDTRQLSNGPHQLEVWVVDTRGHRIQLQPGIMTVTVGN